MAPMLSRIPSSLLALILVAAPVVHSAEPEPAASSLGLVVTEQAIASRVGVEVLKEGGNAMDAAIATAFALAVTHPTAGNIGGGGLLLYRPVRGAPIAYEFRETAPHGASPTMFLRDGRYDPALHHRSLAAVGVPGTVAGLYLAWSEQGTLPWARLVAPSIRLAKEGFPIPEGLAQSLARVLPDLRGAARAQYSRGGTPYAAGDTLVQEDLGRTLERIASLGPEGFYSGETAASIERATEGRISREDLAAYRAKKREPVQGSYRGLEVLGFPLPSSGGTVVQEILNVLEGYDLVARGRGAPSEIHVVVEAMRRAFADRARFLGDPDVLKDSPAARLVSKEHADALRRTIDDAKASPSDPGQASPKESNETTPFVVVDAARNAVSLTYTLEDSYGVKESVAGFLLNNEMGDFNAGPGLTDRSGLVGTPPNLAAPGKRMLSSMSPTILSRDGKVFLVLGARGGRTIPNSVLETILNVVDFGMGVQAAVDAPRFHHQWLPDVIGYEREAVSKDALRALEGEGHRFQPMDAIGIVEAILADPRSGLLQGGSDHRAPDGAAVFER
jgi:gamma-glutamyltranspeptidase/glutathione hydrolase